MVNPKRPFAFLSSGIDPVRSIPGSVPTIGNRAMGSFISSPYIPLEQTRTGLGSIVSRSTGSAGGSAMPIPLAVVGAQLGGSIVKAWLGARAQGKAAETQAKAANQSMQYQREGELHNRRMFAQEQQQQFPRRRAANAALQWGLKDTGAIEQGLFDYGPNTWDADYVLTADQGRLARQVERGASGIDRSSWGGGVDPMAGRKERYWKDASGKERAFTYLSPQRNRGGSFADLTRRPTDYRRNERSAAPRGFRELVDNRVSLGPQGRVRSMSESVAMSPTPGMGAVPRGRRRTLSMGSMAPQRRA